MNDNREIFEVPGVQKLMILARNIRFVNSNLSTVQESKLIPAS
jgi:hypothetical protein